jgi:uracil-DNA glycosylase family 4
MASGSEARIAVPPGTGWPLDPATASTPVAGTPLEVLQLARAAATAHDIDAASSVCRACDRLVRWREEVAVVRRRSFDHEQYWGRPTVGFGPPDARLAILGLAPAAHGGNRTGRIFTGDRSGDWLFAALHRAGLASQAESVSAGDGMTLFDTRIVASVRCAPPDNKPTPGERAACEPWLVRELQLLAPTVRVIVVLGGFAWNAAWPALTSAGYTVPRPRPPFGHGAETRIGNLVMLGCYHVSQQNTFTGRLTTDMLDGVFARAKQIIAAAD